MPVTLEDMDIEMDWLLGARLRDFQRQFIRTPFREKLRLFFKTGRWFPTRLESDTEMKLRMRAIIEGEK